MSELKDKWRHKIELQKQQGLEKNRARYRKYYRKNREKEIERKKRYYKRQREKLINNLGGRCSFCGQFDSGFNIHHRVPMEVFENKISHYFRNIDLMLLLCIDCHIQWHNVMDWLGLDDIFKDG